MPTPKMDETEKDFIARCIPVVLDDESAGDQKQAVAMCYSMWREWQKKKSIDIESDTDTLVMFGGVVKALGDGNVGGYLVRFSDDESPDLEGEFFDAQTDYGIVRDSLAFYNHGLDAKLRGKALGEPAELGKDEIGIWIKHQLDLRNKWERAVYGLAEKGKLSWSSGTAPHLVEREPAGKAVRIARWLLGLDASYTPTPAEPRNVALPLKSWAEMAPVLEMEPQGGVDETAPATMTAGAVTVNVNIATPTEKAITEVKTMSEKEETLQAAAPVVDMSALSAALATAVKDGFADAIKANNEQWEKRLAKEGPVNKAGFVTGMKDEADRALEGNPYKTFGEFLMEVANAATLGQANPRLLPLKSNDPLNESGYSVGGAMGLKFVGSMYGAALDRQGIKAVATTGMSEGYAPSAGFLVGTDVQPGILARAYAVGDLLQRVTMTQISAGSNSMTFHAEDETSRADGSRRGGIRAYYVAEGGTPTTTRPKFRDINLKLKKVAGICYVTDEQLADAAQLESYIMQYLPEELRFVTEDAIMNGTGAGMPLGILNSGGVKSIAKETGQVADTLTAQNIIKMWAGRWTRANDYVWLIDQSVLPQLLQMSLAVGTGGQVLYMPPGGLSASPYGTLLGRPVIESEYCTSIGDSGDIYLVAFSQYQMIEKGGIESASSIHVNFVTAETCFRFIYRHDGSPTWNSVLTLKSGTATVSPYVKLDAR